MEKAAFAALDGHLLFVPRNRYVIAYRMFCDHGKRAAYLGEECSTA